MQMCDASIAEKLVKRWCYFSSAFTRSLAMCWSNRL